MALDLSNVDTNPAASPADGDVVSAGASKIRDTRTATMNSFGGTSAGAGGTFSEHYLSGAHKFPNGDGTFPGLPGVPAAGNAGRLFIDTTNQRILRDTGAAWNLLRAVQVFGTSAAGPVNSGINGSFTTIVQMASINIPAGNYNLIVICNFGTSNAVTSTLNYRLTSDSATVIGQADRADLTLAANGTPHQYMIYGATAAIASGNHTVELRVTSANATAYSLAGIQISAFVL